MKMNYRNGFTILALSMFWCVFLLVRTKSILGQKILWISGSNIFDAQGIALSGFGHLVLWFIGIIGICYGLFLVINSPIQKDEKSNQNANSQTILSERDERFNEEMTMEEYEKLIEETEKEDEMSDVDYCVQCGEGLSNKKSFKKIDYCESCRENGIL